MTNQTIQGFRLSPQQKYVWLKQQPINPTLSNLFCSQIALLIKGNLQVNRLQNSLESIIKRYDILRTNYKHIQGIKLPVQVVNDFFYLHWKQDKNPTQSIDQTIKNIFKDHRKKLNKLNEITLFYSSLLTVSETENFLLISLPTLNSDAETLKNLTQEIYNIYHQKDNNDEPIQYLQFSEWQNELLEDEDATEGFNYWQQERQQPKASLKLPFEQQTSNPFNPKTYTLEIDKKVTEKINSVVTSYNITIDNFLLTCWQIFISKLTNENHIIVNTNYNGRTYEELQDILGLVNKLIPVCGQIEESTTLNNLLIKTHETFSNHRPWQDYYLGDEDDITPIAFEFQTYPKQYKGDEITISLYQQYICSDRFKLKLFCLLQENSLKTQFYYDASIFNFQEIQRFAEYFQTLLHNILTYPNTQIKDLKIIKKNHINQLLNKLNQTDFEHPRLTSFQEKFEQQVKQTPENTALVYEEKKLSYQQLNEKANQLAHYLIKLGIKPDMPIPVYGDRSLEMIIAMLGIMKAGGAYLPIDSALPFAGLQQRLEEVKADILITQKFLIIPQSLPNYKVINLNKDWQTISQNSNQNPQIQLTPETLAYIIFTSGSTGQPKGVAIEQRQLLNYLHSIIKALDIPINANFALVSTLAADLGHTCIFPALATGGCLHLISQERAANAKALGDYFQQHSIDCLKIVPSHLQALLAADPQGSFLPRQRLILGGEAAPWGLIDQIRQKAPNCRLFNHYGPTETTVGVTTFPIEFQTPTVGTVPIGRPIDNTQLYILDPYLKPVPMGVTGELYIGGAGVARGYLNRPELTAQRFISNPFNPQERLYKTGDNVRYLADGNIEFLDRLDNQVKIHGFRIELGEIEATLLENPHIFQAVVIAKEEHLIAYIVAEKNTSEPDQWREFLQRKLPDYMIPSSYVQLKALPLTKNGKIDRHKLPDPQIQNTVEFVAPRNEIEAQLCEIWAEVLGVESIGIDDNFFTLGGHSLQAIQLVSKISMVMNCDISVKSLFLRPTVAKFSPILENKSKPSQPMNQVTQSKPEVQLSPFVKVEHRSLLTLLLTGKIPPIDSAALTYFPTPDFNQLEQLGWTPQTLIEEFSDNLPIISTILETPLGRIALMCLPRFLYQLYENKNNTVNVIIETLELAKQIGAKTVSLTGLLPSATDYGKAVTQAISSRQDLPLITTGHGTTSATVVLSIENILREANRNISQEKIGFLGLGSVGISTLRLMLKTLPHPQEILLCDIYDKLDQLEAIKQEIINQFNFKGDVHLILSKTEVPPEMYQSGLIVGATNVADILDVNKLNPGTLIVDDSAPHCFSAEKAIKRLETHQDILFTEGGILRPSQAIERLIYLPNNIQKVMTEEQRYAYLNRQPFNITGCVFSSLLSTRFEQLKPTLGLVDLDTSLQHYKVLKDLNFRAADLSCENYQLSTQLIDRFQQQFK
ncbi:non-ribosomal peptide synthetase [Crocosphaera chwakensis]|uniref:Amino acid adenylation n=1 Tax=Crocosphaera chwakensis CCY0110 TaxID=391612 RepID=A3INW7_9CHRO|nr:non-ribosomal peptide synthetase [Crocosphaera chwakensis]EAZ91769.1 Amino acid adenylation [Crocosphaera chwakensis CCY0110]